MTIVSDRVLYPAAPGAAPVCWTCFQPRTDLAATADKRIAGGDLVETCLSCFHALASGQPVELPSREELPDLLRSWARWDVNDEVDDEFVQRMFQALLPGLTPDEAADWFRCLQEALLEIQDRSEPGFELASVEPEARDIEALIADSVAKADEALEALLGGAR